VIFTAAVFVFLLLLLIAKWLKFSFVRVEDDQNKCNMLFISSWLASSECKISNLEHLLQEISDELAPFLSRQVLFSQDNGLHLQKTLEIQNEKLSAHSSLNDESMNAKTSDGSLYEAVDRSTVTMPERPLEQIQKMISEKETRLSSLVAKATHFVSALRHKNTQIQNQNKPFSDGRKGEFDDLSSIEETIQQLRLKLDEIKRQKKLDSDQSAHLMPAPSSNQRGLELVKRRPEHAMKNTRPHDSQPLYESKGQPQLGRGSFLRATKAPEPRAYSVGPAEKERQPSLSQCASFETISTNDEIIQPSNSLEPESFCKLCTSGEPQHTTSHNEYRVPQTWPKKSLHASFTSAIESREAQQFNRKMAHETTSWALKSDTSRQTSMVTHLDYDLQREHVAAHFPRHLEKRNNRARSQSIEPGNSVSMSSYRKY